jgi:membrane associated rhomboid family serine protease
MDTNFIIIIFTVAVSIYVIYNPEYKSRLLHYPYNVNKNKEYYRLISNGFIHADYIHLFFNMFTLYFFGGRVEDLFTAKFGMWGDTIFILFYISAIAFSCLPSQRKHAENPAYAALGASGAVSSVLLIAIILQPTMTLLIYGVLPVPAWILGIGYIWYSNRASKQQQRSNIGHDAHLYGAFYGCIVMALLYPSSYPRMIQEIIAWLPI